MSFTESSDTEGSAANESVEFEPSAEEVEANEGGETEAAGEEFTGERYTVKIGGEEHEVTLDELLNGYQRQSDYTRKTQELASERERLASLAALETALNEDPAGTIEVLKEVFGLTQKEAEAFADELDPVDRDLAELKSWKAQQEEAARVQAVQRESQAAIQKHGLSVTDQELVSFAYQNQIANLDVAGRLLKAELREREADSKRAETVDAKRAAAVVEGGASRNRKGQGQPQPRSIREAFAQAQSELS